MVAFLLGNGADPVDKIEPPLEIGKQKRLDEVMILDDVPEGQLLLEGREGRSGQRAQRAVDRFPGGGDAWDQRGEELDEVERGRQPDDPPAREAREAGRQLLDPLLARREAEDLAALTKEPEDVTWRATRTA